MDIEELNKTQVILLVLLVSFVTSIATGIVTVSLLAQAPPAVTQTVNHIIERTVQAATDQSASATNAVKETTVVVKEDDLVTKSIADSFNRVGVVHASSATTSSVVALGAIIAPGVIATDLASVVTVTGADKFAVEIGGETAVFRVARALPDIGIVLLSGTTTDPFKVVDAGSLKLGQTVVALYGAVSRHVGMSTVSAVGPLLDAEGAPVGAHELDTTLDTLMTPGAPLISIFGDLVGISTTVSRADGRGSFVAASDILTLMKVPAATSTVAH